MSEVFDGIFFLCFPSGDRTKITVIDLGNSVSYERDHWANVNDNTYHTSIEAIEAGRDIAKRHKLNYEVFESRYGNPNEGESKSEYLY